MGTIRVEGVDKELVPVGAIDAARKQALLEVAEKIEALRGHTPVIEAAYLCRELAEKESGDG